MPYLDKPHIHITFKTTKTEENVLREIYTRISENRGDNKPFFKRYSQYVH